MNNKIEVHIVGTANCGKTTIGLLIENCLKENGIDAEFCNDNTTFTKEELLEHQEKCLEIIKNRDVKLFIKSFQAVRGNCNESS